MNPPHTLLIPENVNMALALKQEIQCVLGKRHIGICQEFGDQETDDEGEGDEGEDGYSSRSQLICSILQDTEESHIGKLERKEEYKLTLRDSEANVVFDGFMFELNDEVKVAELFAQAELSKFGNQKTMENEFNPKIRNAREFIHFDLSNELISALTEHANDFWSGCEVLPYKVNVYGPDGHFDYHRDTPETGLIGTLILGLCQSGSMAYHLKLTGYKDPVKWPAENGSIITFYPDQAHKVAKGAGYRMSLSCKVFMRSSRELTNLSAPMMRLANEMSTWQKPFGFIFKYQYSVTETSAWKGIDQQVLTIIRTFGWCHVLQPVVVHHVKTTESESKPEIETTVHPIDPVAPELASGFQCVFIKLEDGTHWETFKDPGAEYTGNESRPKCVDSVYLHFGLIVLSEEPKHKKAKIATESNSVG
jgi:hypothetical protein